MKTIISHSIFFLTLFFLFSFFAYAQNRTFIGAEAAMTHDIYELSDKDNRIIAGPVISGMGGLVVGQEIGKHIVIESGILKKAYEDGYKFKGDFLFNGTGGNAIETWQIPLRLRTRFNLLNEKLFFNTTIGYHYCINSENQSDGYLGSGGASAGGERNGNDSISSTYTSNYNLQKTFSLLETGAGLEFVVFKKLHLTLTAAYFTGFSKVMEYDIIYRVNENPPVNAQIFSKGEYWSLAFGIRYPISSLWVGNK